MSEHESCAIPSMTVSELLADPAAEPLGLDLLAGEDGLDNLITRPRVQLPGLALAGFLEYVHAGMVEILGKSEMAYLAERAPTERARIVAQICRQGVACLVVTNGRTPMPELIRESDRNRVPLLVVPRPAAAIVDALERYLEDRLAPRTVVHGVLLEVYGLGVFILGDSGVGKSECALDLVVRGHRLVSDDVVEIKRIGQILEGTGPELTRYHMELRGLGIVNVKDLFGVAAVRMTKHVELVIRLDPWQPGKRYDRLGLDERTFDILGVDLPFVEMPVGPGRNLSVLIEVAARNHLLKRKGYHPARDLARRLGDRLKGVSRWYDDSPVEVDGREPEDGED